MRNRSVVHNPQRNKDVKNVFCNPNCVFVRVLCMSKYTSPRIVKMVPKQIVNQLCGFPVVCNDAGN